MRFPIRNGLVAIIATLLLMGGQKADAAGSPANDFARGTDESIRIGNLKFQLSQLS